MANYKQLCIELVRIADALDSGAPLVSNQGQALDGYSALAMFRTVATQARADLAESEPEYPSDKDVIDHPLTDEMIANLACTQAFTQPLTDEKYDDIAESMRSAYDLAIEHYSKWIYENGDDYVIQHYEHNIKTDLDTIVADFHKAMRPQQQEDN